MIYIYRYHVHHVHACIWKKMTIYIVIYTCIHVHTCWCLCSRADRECIPVQWLFCGKKRGCFTNLMHLEYSGVPVFWKTYEQMIHHRCTCLCIIRQHNILCQSLGRFKCGTTSSRWLFCEKSEVFHKFDALRIFSSHHPFNIIYFLIFYLRNPGLHLEYSPRGARR